MALVTGGVHGNGVLVLHVGRPMPVKGPLHLVHVQFPGQLAADLADHLKIVQPVGTKIDVAEKLPVQVPVKLFHKTPVRTTAVVLQKHQGQFALGGEDTPRALFGFPKPKGSYQSVPGDRQIYPSKIALEKPGVKRFELLCLGRKCEAVLEIVDSSYLGHRN